MIAIVSAASGLILYHFFLHPLLLIILSSRSGRSAWSPDSEAEDFPTVSVLVPCCNEGGMIAEKADNLLNQDYPHDRMEIVFAGDGSQANLETILGPRCQQPNLRAISFTTPRGKIPVLNDAVQACHGKILVMTDVGAHFETGTVSALVDPFSDSTVGGVCGVHRVAQSNGKRDMGGAQALYWRLDGCVKKAESRLGSISSSDGPIYAIRRALYTPIPAAVTDDSFQAMAIVRQGWRFIYSPEAIARIQPRSKSFGHEIRRRRRVVVRSLRGLWLSRELMNLRRYGVYALSLLTQKVLRRCLPLLLILVLASTAILGINDGLWRMICLSQASLYGMGASLFLAPIPRRRGLRWAARLQTVCGYFLAGQIGTLLGGVDFLRGRRVERWTPAQR
jgi:cellulose synthase/poly-beta-1,6-N-acetylglucosamine synthase-like glycosyltransferase